MGNCREGKKKTGKLGQKGESGKKNVKKLRRWKGRGTGREQLMKGTRRDKKINDKYKTEM